MLVVMIIAALYFLAPLWWFLVSATKSNGGLYSGNPFWFHDFSLAENFTDIVHRDGGIYFRWLRNSVFYSLVAGVGAGLISAMAGYALAKFRFRGRDAVFNCVLAATLLPIMLLTVPLYLMFSKVGLVDTISKQLVWTARVKPAFSSRSCCASSPPHWPRCSLSSS